MKPHLDILTEVKFVVYTFHIILFIFIIKLSVGVVTRFEFADYAYNLIAQAYEQFSRTLVVKLAL